MTTELIIFVAVSAFLGGLINALLAWAKQQPPEPFDGRKFGVSAIASFLGAIVIAVGYNYSGIQNVALACLVALLSGAGVTSAVGNISGAIAARSAKLKK